MKILIIAPHADDEILGVGGTIARYAKEGHQVYVCVVTRGYPPLFSNEFMGVLREETIKSHEFLNIAETFFLEFPSVTLEKENRYDINEKIADVIQSIMPDEVYIPHMGDMQKDHQIVADAAMVALRPKYSHVVKRIYVYETLSETGWNMPNAQNAFIPNVYADISDFLGKKLEAMAFFRSQLDVFPAARSLEAIEALAKFRGATVGLQAAEAFWLVREIC